MFVYGLVVCVSFAVLTGELLFPLVILPLAGLIGGLIGSYVSLYTVPLSTQDTHVYQRRKMSFDTDKIHVQSEDGSEVHITWNHIMKVKRLGNYYCLYLNHGFFLSHSHYGVSFRGRSNTI
jgi:hypothetical protein